MMSEKGVDTDLRADVMYLGGVVLIITFAMLYDSGASVSDRRQCARHVLIGTILIVMGRILAHLTNQAPPPLFAVVFLPVVVCLALMRVVDRRIAQAGASEARCGSPPPASLK